MKLRFKLIIILISIYSVFFYYTTQNKNDRIDLALKQEIKNLQTHYNLTIDYFINDATSIRANISKNKKIIEILKKAQKAPKNKKDILREELYKSLIPMYSRLQTRGILQWQFVFPNNVSFLRMHKPNKYGDDLTNIRFSLSQVNKFKKIIVGFEQGRSSHGFRYVFPLYDSNKEYLGAIDISLSSAYFKNKLKNINKLHLHFLVNKNIFYVKTWEEKDLIVDYMPSIEHKDYMFTIGSDFNKKNIVEKEKNIISPLRDKINKNIKLGKPFSLYIIINKSAKVITFLPIKNTKNDISAYIVTYEDSKNIYNIYYNYKLFNIIILIGLILIFYFIYKNILRKVELTKSLNLMSKYVIYSKTDLNGIITDVSDAFCDISKYSKSEIIGNTHRILRHPSMLTELYKDLWNTISNEKQWKGEIININKNKEPFWVFPSISPEYDSDGMHIGYIAISYDITSKKNFDEQHKKLMHSEKLAGMGEMIGNIAHQWRQPLSVISTVSTGMVMKQEFGMLKDEDILKNCNTINENAQYLSKTIDDFKNFIKGDRTKKVFNLSRNINNFLHLVKGTIKTHNIDIILELDDEINIHGYENELIQCFINIFNNSKDALNENNIKDKKIIITTRKEDNNIIIKIKDNALGIPNNILPKIFDPYFTTKQKTNGTGLGLNMTYRLITEGMDGEIIAQNERYIHKDIEYTGALFSITLPYK